MEPYLHALIAYLSAHPDIGLIAVFAAATLESIVVVGVLVPGSALIFVAGVLIGLRVLDPTWTTLAAVLGATLGDGFNYWLGGHYRDRIRTMPLLRRQAPLLARAEAHFVNHGGSSILVGRMVAPLRSLVPIVAGMSDMPALRFYVFNILSALAWAAVHLLPGALFGASLQLAGAISSRLAVVMVLLAVLAWLLWWSASLLLTHMPPAMARARTRVVAWAHTGSTALHRAVLALFDPQRPESAALLVSALVLIGSAWLFFGVLKNVLAHDALVNFDSALFAALQQLRSAWIDNLMVAITEIGGLRVAAPVIVAVALVLAYKRCWRTLAYWLAAQGVAVLLVSVLKLGVARTRPSPIYSGIEQYSFPSAHAASAIVLYGFLGYLLARRRSIRVQLVSSAAVASFVVLIGLSRVYLGAHWFSDVLGGLSFGLGWLVLLCIAYAHHVGNERVPVRALVAVSLATIVAAAAVQFGTRVDADLARYQPRAEPAAAPLDDWLDTGWRGLAPSRTDFSGEVEEPMALQWAATQEQITATLHAAGWQAPAPWALSSALLWLLPSPAIDQLPVLAKFHQDVMSSILLTRAVDPQTRLVLRLWPSGRVVDAPAAPRPTALWLGTVTLERLKHPAGAFTIARTDVDFAQALRLLGSDLESQAVTTQWRDRRGMPVVLAW
jgi:undecaprenyl-diphosphatase